MFDSERQLCQCDKHGLAGCGDFANKLVEREGRAMYVCENCEFEGDKELPWKEQMTNKRAYIKFHQTVYLEISKQTLLMAVSCPIAAKQAVEKAMKDKPGAVESSISVEIDSLEISFTEED
jgi:hypothetical protein